MIRIPTVHSSTVSKLVGRWAYPSEKIWVRQLWWWHSQLILTTMDKSSSPFPVTNQKMAGKTRSDITRRLESTRESMGPWPSPAPQRVSGSGPWQFLGPTAIADATPQGDRGWQTSSHSRQRNSMEILRDFDGFDGISWIWWDFYGFYRNWLDFLWDFVRSYGEMTRIWWDFMISWDFDVISWAFFDQCQFFRKNKTLDTHTHTHNVGPQE